MTNFGRELKAQRAACGLSQSQAAACVPFLSVRTLQCWEHGHQSPPVWAQCLIMDKLRVQTRAETFMPQTGARMNWDAMKISCPRKPNAERKKVAAVGAKRSAPKRKKSNDGTLGRDERVPAKTEDRKP
jgi:DNA-binding XRE family transcriptional regulator